MKNLWDFPQPDFTNIFLVSVHNFHFRHWLVAPQIHSRLMFSIHFFAHSLSLSLLVSFPTASNTKHRVESRVIINIQVSFFFAMLLLISACLESNNVKISGEEKFVIFYIYFCVLLSLSFLSLQTYNTHFLVGEEEKREKVAKKKSVLCWKIYDLFSFDKSFSSELCVAGFLRSQALWDCWISFAFFILFLLACIFMSLSEELHLGE